MISLSKLQKFLDDYLYFDKKLDITKIDAFMANGLVVKGKGEIKKIGFAVSASLALFEKTKQENCDALVAHHAFNLPSVNRYDQIFQSRIGFLIENKISLFGYHFLLDAHPQLGNNIAILKFLKTKPTIPYYHRGDPWGWIGQYDKAVDFNHLISLVKPQFSSRAVIYDFGPDKIKKVVVVSGKGAPLSDQMQTLIDQKIDLYITGEVHEWNRELFREAKINFIAGGHYHTERFGIKALMKKVKEKFPQVETLWIDLINDI